MKTLRYRLEPAREHIPDLCAQLVEQLDQVSAPPEVGMAVELALDELLTNTISYGFESTEHADIGVELDLADNHLVLRLSDNGRAFDPFAEVAPVDIDADIDDRQIGGLGIHLVRETMDDVHYERSADRNVLTLTKRWASDPAGNADA